MIRIWIINTEWNTREHGVCLCVCICSDVLFGVPGKHTGVSHYNRKRVVTYTITIVLSRYNAG